MAPTDWRLRLDPGNVGRGGWLAGAWAARRRAARRGARGLEHDRARATRASPGTRPSSSADLLCRGTDPAGHRRGQLPDGCLAERRLPGTPRGRLRRVLVPLHGRHPARARIGSRCGSWTRRSRRDRRAAPARVPDRQRVVVRRVRRSVGRRLAREPAGHDPERLTSGSRTCRSTAICATSARRSASRWRATSRRR